MFNTPRRDGTVINLAVAADKEITEGAIVALTEQGFLVEATDQSATLVVGRANEAAYNLKGAAGDSRANVQRQSAFLFANATGADEVKEEHLFEECFLFDAFTVAAIEGDPARLSVGKVIEISKEGVWVEIA